MPAMRYVVNRFRQDGVFPVNPREPIRVFHRSLPGYAPTPLVRRPALARSLGVAEIYIKYEGTRYGLQAFKGLGASWALHRLLETRAGSFATVATASEGNHGRAVAWAARLMKVPCVIFLPARAAPERVENIRREGATIVLVDGNYEAAVRQCDVESNRQGWQIISDVGYEGYLEIPPLVVEGYSTLYLEVDEQVAEAGWPVPNVVLMPGGVGGILHAGVDHYRSRPAPPRLVGVEPAEGDCLTESLESESGGPAVSRGNRRTTMACLNCAEVSWPSWPNIRRGVDGLLALDDHYAVEAVRALYRAAAGETVLEAGNSGAAATGGLMALMREDVLRAGREQLGLGPDSVVLCLCTEAAIDQAAFHRALGA